MKPGLREIPGFDGYFCDREGNVFSSRKNVWRQMTPVPDRCGYMRLHLPPKVGAKRKNVFIHTLIASTWLGKPADPTMQINHKNACRTDNRADNLEWTTLRANVIDCWQRTRAMRSGEKHPMARLSDGVVAAIRGLHDQGVKPAAIMARYGLKRNAVKNILSRRSRTQ